MLLNLKWLPFIVVLLYKTQKLKHVKLAYFLNADDL